MKHYLFVLHILCHGVQAKIHSTAGLATHAIQEAQYEHFSGYQTRCFEKPPFHFYPAAAFISISPASNALTNASATSLSNCAPASFFISSIAVYASLSQRPKADASSLFLPLHRPDSLVSSVSCPQHLFYLRHAISRRASVFPALPVSNSYIWLLQDNSLPHALCGRRCMDPFSL